jgi:predicted SnoaL-like aldol condensation-catalyzing enzyme
VASTPELNKKAVRDFYDLAFNQRKPAEAAARYIGNRYVQHNPSIADGVEGFVAGLGAMLAAAPQLKVETKRMIAEGDLVAMHSHSVRAPGELGRAVMDFFRLEDGKIVEHWDASQPVPEKSANGNTMF